MTLGTDEVDLNVNGTTVCKAAATTHVFSNCSTYIGGRIAGTTTKTQVNNCYLCKTGFAVGNKKLTCTAFTKDTQCRFLDGLGTGCEGCKENYHFGGTTCVLSSNLIGLAFVALVALFFA